MEKLKLFVPLGTQKFPFDRLVKVLNSMIKDGTYSPNEIIIQTTVIGKEIPLFKTYSTIPISDFNNLLDQAGVVITHSGVNSIITSMMRNKPLIIVPRMKKFGEHVDNHQLEIAKIMEDKYKVLVVRDTDKLKGCIQEALKHKYLPYISKRKELVTAIENIIDSL